MSAEPTPAELIHVPLAPFDNLTPGTRCYSCDGPISDELKCTTTDCPQYNVQRRSVQRRAGSKDDRIDPEGRYFAKIHGDWFYGQFSEEWYGWNFNNWGASGIQLDSIEDLYLFRSDVLS